ncbi:hypothetical protein P7C70_g9088, partial [Phenoliferia sp. Uapishka_3]
MKQSSASGRGAKEPKDSRPTRADPPSSLSSTSPPLYDSQCLLNSLPLELLKNIRVHLFNGLNHLDDQLQRYRVTSVSHAFAEFFATRSRGIDGLSVGDSSRAKALARAIRKGRAAPNSLILHISKEEMGSDMEMTKFTKLLVRCWASLQRLEISWDPESALHWTREGFMSALANLGMLQVFVQRGESPFYSNDYECLFAGWPFLRGLHLHSAIDIINIPDFHPIPNLRSLTLHWKEYVPPGFIMELFDNHHPLGWIPSTMDPDETDVVAFVKALLPNLKHLDYHGECSIYPMITIANCLRILDIDSTAVAPADGEPASLFKTLGALPLLEELLLSISDDTSWLEAKDVVAYFAGGCKSLRHFIIRVRTGHLAQSPLKTWTKDEKNEVYDAARLADVRFVLR